MDTSKHQQEAQEFKVSKGYAYYVFLLLFLLYLFNYVDRYDLLTAFKFLPLFAVVGGVAFFIGSFYYVRDLKKVEKVGLKE